MRDPLSSARYPRSIHGRLSHACDDERRARLRLRRRRLTSAYGVPLDTAIVAGAMCGFSGMLPDLDSDYGVPLRETMAFTAAIVPMLLVGRFQSLASQPRRDGRSPPCRLYLFVRFGVTNMIRKYTVHRGMFHSIPAC